MNSNLLGSIVRPIHWSVVQRRGAPRYAAPYPSPSPASASTSCSSSCCCFAAGRWTRRRRRRRSCCGLPRCRREGTRPVGTGAGTNKMGPGASTSSPSCCPACVNLSTMENGFLASLPCPVLTKSNYVPWAIRMKVYLEAHGLWDAIDGAKGPVDPSRDRQALAAIHLAISSSDTLFKIARKETAREAWQALRTIHLGTEPVMRARVAALKRELEAVKMKDPESVDDFESRVTALVVNIRAHGGKVEEGYVVRKLLWAVSPKFTEIADIVEELCDLESMTVEDLVGRLKAYEIRLGEAEMKRGGEEGCGAGGFKGRGGHGSGCGDAEGSNDYGKKDRKTMKDGFLASLPCPALTKGNYMTWVIRMKVYLEAHGLWDAINGAKGPVDPSTDSQALAAIHLAISSRDTIFKIIGKETAREAWQALRIMGLGTEPVMRARVAALKGELEAVRMKDTENVDDFVSRVTAIVVNIRAHGGKVGEGYVVRKLLWDVSPKFSQIALDIEVVCDLESMTVEDVAGRLKAYEIRLGEAEMKRGGEEGCGGGGFKGRCGHGSGCGDGEGSNDHGKKDRKFDKSKVRCFNCRDYGHFASECRKPNK